MDEFELVKYEATSNTPVISLSTLLSKVYEEKISEITNDKFLNQKATRFILAVLSRENGLTQNDLVRVTHMKGSTISITLSKLEEKGMILRKDDGYDMRCLRVFLTEKGYDLASKHREVLNTVESNARKDITPNELKQAIYVLETYLNTLLENKK
jgi:DNA-binding MarR family transcriptional regulator